MSFDVSAAAYASFMGRYSEPLADSFIAWAQVRPEHRALDVGCGPGVVTERLASIVGAGGVAAVDPSESFVAAARERCPGVDVRQGVAEELPFPDGSFDVALAQLVVSFMSDPVAGLREMARVTRPGGLVAACVWDFATGRGPLSTFWAAAHRFDPPPVGETQRPGTREGHIAELAAEAGLVDAEPGSLTVSLAFTTFDQWWDPFTLGVGPAGEFAASLSAADRERLRGWCQEALPPAPFTVEALAWSARARVPA